MTIASRVKDLLHRGNKEFNATFAYSGTTGPVTLVSYLSYFIFTQFVKSYLIFEVMSGILQQEIVPHSYRDRLGLHSLSVFCPVAESFRISMTKSSAKILESSEFNPRSTQSDSFQLTIYDPPPLLHSRKLPFLNVILIGARF